MLALGGLSILSGVLPYVGLAMLAVFLVGVTPKMHDYWNHKDPMQRMGDRGPHGAARVGGGSVGGEGGGAGRVGGIVTEEAQGEEKHGEKQGTGPPVPGTLVSGCQSIGLSAGVYSTA